MALKQKGAEAPADAKKRRRVGFTQIDSGVEANDCIKIHLVRNQDEVCTTKGILIDPVDLNHFFGDDGKIYGYKDLQVDIWLSCVSFLAHADIKYSSKSNGGKGITDLKAEFKNIFGESLVDKEVFLQSFTTEAHYIRTILSEGTVILCDPSKEDDNTSDCHLDARSSTIEVIRMDLQSLSVGLLYSRLVPLVLLLVEGGNPIDVTDSRWEIHFAVKKMQDQSGDYIMHLLGFSAIYHFYHYPDSTRLRNSQILVLPPYQGKGHGRLLLEALNSVAISENVYDVTIEEPSEYFQYIRTCIDTLRLLTFDPIKPAIDPVISYLKEANLSKRSCRESQPGPPRSVIELARQKLKINKKQFLRCWEILIFVLLEPKKGKLMENFKVFVSDRLKREILDKDAGAKGKKLVEVPNDYGHEMTFAVFWSADDDGEDSNMEEGDRATQEQQLNQLVDKQIEEVAAVAQKVVLFRGN